MTTPVSSARDLDVATFEQIVHHPSLAEEFDLWQGEGRAAELLSDPFAVPELRMIARDGSEPVGFSVPYLLESTHDRFAMVRIGVIESHRRRGLGSQLLIRTIEGIQALAPNVHEISINAWMPNDAATGFAEHHGFRRVRSYWMMERKGLPVPDVALPAGITLAIFDGSDSGLRDYTEAYNASFAEHYHYIRSSVEDTRAFAARASFRKDGLALAYRDGRCVGFCRCELFEGRGEIGILGTVPDARGIQLGRALLHWGVAWLERERAPRVTLMVDGENETALGLYRSAGFDVTRTRAIWGREP